MKELLSRIGRCAAAVALSVTMLTASGAQAALATTSHQAAVTPIQVAAAGPNCSYFVWARRYMGGMQAFAKWSTSTAECRAWSGRLYLQTWRGYALDGPVTVDSDQLGCAGCRISTSLGSAGTGGVSPIKLCTYGYARAQLRVDGTPNTYYTRSWQACPSGIPNP